MQAVGHAKTVKSACMKEFHGGESVTRHRNCVDCWAEAMCFEYATFTGTHG